MPAEPGAARDQRVMVKQSTLNELVRAAEANEHYRGVFMDKTSRELLRAAIKDGKATIRRMGLNGSRVRHG